MSDVILKNLVMNDLADEFDRDVLLKIAELLIDSRKNKEQKKC